jgi:acyl-CoA synthetase (NDP forming)
MKVFTEKQAEEFLRQKGFEIIETSFIKNENELENELKKFKMPVVLKISSKQIVHKMRVNGVKLNIWNYCSALKAFRELKKIKGFEGVLIQPQIKGKEFLLGLKKTSDFGYVIAFGEGGTNVEEKKKVNFRVCGVNGFDELTSNKHIQKLMSKLCSLSNCHIESLDINPLILKKEKAVIVDSHIIFE